MSRYVRLATQNGPRYARVDNVGFRILDKAPWFGGRETGAIAPGGERLVPIEPSKIVCVGRNYVAHAKERGAEVPIEPLLFFKPPSSLTLGPIVLPVQSTNVEHEGELGVIVGARLRNASEEEAARAVFGFVTLCDVSARDLQKKDGQWTRAKGFDSFCPVGLSVTTGLDWFGRDVGCVVNGEKRQAGNTRDMVFSVPFVLSYISQAMTLEPGDLIATGTPAGVGPLRPGDVVEVTVDGVETLRTLVRA